MRPEQLLKLSEEREAYKTKAEMDAEFRQAIRQHKAKFWTKFDGRNLDEIRIFGDNPEKDREILDRMRKEGKIRGFVDTFLGEESQDK